MGVGARVCIVRARGCTVCAGCMRSDYRLLACVCAVHGFACVHIVSTCAHGVYVRGVGVHVCMQSCTHTWLYADVWYVGVCAWVCAYVGVGWVVYARVHGVCTHGPVCGGGCACVQVHGCVQAWVCVCMSRVCTCAWYVHI